MTTGHKTRIPGFRLDPKTGRIVREQRRLDVSARLRQRNSKRVKAVPRHWQSPLGKGDPRHGRQ